MKKTPQQHWQSFLADLPDLSRRQRWGLIGGIITILMAFVLFVLPFLLPLMGPEPVALERLGDPEGSFINIDGVELYYEHFPSEGENVLLIHGQAGSTETWRETAPALQRAGFNVYAIDWLGLGLSEKGAYLDYSYPHEAQLFLDFMASEAIDSAVIVAHAFGANIAVMMSQQSPDTVDKLVLVAPTLFTEPTPEIPEWILNLGFLRRWARVGMHLVVHEAVGEQLRSATRIDEVVTDELIEAYGRVLRTENWDLAVLGMLRDSHKNALQEPLVSLEQPVLLIWGDEDGWATPDNADWMLEAIPNSCLVLLPGIGHLPMHEDPDQFSATLMAFLNNSCNNIPQTTSYKETQID